MTKPKEFPFERARRVTAREVESARKAIEAKLGVKRPRRGRPPKAATEKYRPVSIRLHPKVIEWAKKEARRRGVGYQTIINEALLRDRVIATGGTEPPQGHPPERASAPR